MKIILFGAGAYAKSIWKQIEKDRELYSDEYIAFADNNEKLWGKYFCEKKVISPDTIGNYEKDLIVIVSNRYEDVIRKQLTEELKISKEQIYIWPEYTRLCYSNKIFRRRYNTAEKVKRRLSSIDSKNMVVYTAITGNYDSLKDPLFKSDNLTYVCITNNREIKSKIWNMEYIKNSSMDHVYLARHIKMNPHVYFQDFETSIWVDGKYQIMDDFGLYIEKYKDQSNILCFPHPERNCICDETAACILWTKGNNRDMIIQVANYLQDGYPVNNGLYETGCMVRAHKDDFVKRLMNQWEKEINKYSFRDQLSFPYVCWKNAYAPDICNLDINRNQWLLQKRSLY